MKINVDNEIPLENTLDEVDKISLVFESSIKDEVDHEVYPQQNLITRTFKSTQLEEQFLLTFYGKNLRVIIFIPICLVLWALVVLSDVVDRFISHNKWEFVWSYIVSRSAVYVVYIIIYPFYFSFLFRKYLDKRKIRRGWIDFFNLIALVTFPLCTVFVTFSSYVRDFYEFHTGVVIVFFAIQILRCRFFPTALAICIDFVGYIVVLLVRTFQQQFTPSRYNHVVGFIMITCLAVFWMGIQAFIVEYYFRDLFVKRRRTELISKKIMEENVFKVKLLKNIFPEEFLSQLLNWKQGTPFIKQYDTLTVYLNDIVHFTSFSETVPAKELIRILNVFVSVMEEEIGAHGLEKVKTAGDSLLVVDLHDQGPSECVRFAHKVITRVNEFNSLKGWNLEIRTGIAKGKGYLTCIGKNYSFDVYGECVVEVKNMETNSHPSKILVTKSFYENLKENPLFLCVVNEEFENSYFIDLAKEDGFSSDIHYKRQITCEQNQKIKVGGSKTLSSTTTEFAVKEIKINKLLLLFRTSNQHVKFLVKLFEKTKFNILLQLGFSIVIFAVLIMSIMLMMGRFHWSLWIHVGISLVSFCNFVLYLTSLFIFSIFKSERTALILGLCVSLMNNVLVIAFLMSLFFLPKEFLIYTEVTDVGLVVSVFTIFSTSVFNFVFSTVFVCVVFVVYVVIRIITLPLDFGNIVILLCFCIIQTICFYELKLSQMIGHQIQEQILKKLEIYRERSEMNNQLLNSSLPKIAQDKYLSKKERFDFHESAQVVFVQVVFDKGTEDWIPILRRLSELFFRFDTILEKSGCLKIKSIFDNYIVFDYRQSFQILKDCFEFLESAKKCLEEKEGLVIGYHNGKVASGIVGKQKILYDVLGDSINIASRMMTTSKLGEICCCRNSNFSEIAARFECVPRGNVEIKGKGKMEVFFIRKKSEVHKFLEL